MAKRMPYFKFFCSEWNDGDIVFEDYETQGVFINICSLYWSRECNLTKRALERKFPNNLNNILTLQNENILVIDSEDLVIIRFLDQEAKEKDGRSSTSATNGAKGGRPKKPNKPNSKPIKKPSEPKSKPNKTQYREEKIREEKIKEEVDLPAFIDSEKWNDFLTHRKELKKPLTPTSMKGQLKKLEKFESSFPGGANISLEQTVNNGWQGLFEPKIEEFNFDSAPWKVLNTGERVKLDLHKLIVYSENGKKHEDYETDAQGGVSC